MAEPIIVVSGLPRSGTSMVMAMLAAAGLECVSDGIRKADEDNPKGYFEDERVKKLARPAQGAWLAEARGRVIKVVSPLLKDLPAGNQYKILVIRRNLSEVLASQRKMMERRGENHDQPNEAMEKIFERHLEVLDAMLRDRPEMEWLYLDYREVIEDPRGQANRIGEFLDKNLDSEKMSAAVDKKLYRNRAS